MRVGLIVLMSAALCSVSWADVAAVDVMRLQQDLTPIGAERQGNGKDIPMELFTLTPLWRTGHICASMAKIGNSTKIAWLRVKSPCYSVFLTSIWTSTPLGAVRRIPIMFTRVFARMRLGQNCSSMVPEYVMPP